MIDNCSDDNPIYIREALNNVIDYINFNLMDGYEEKKVELTFDELWIKCGGKNTSNASNKRNGAKMLYDYLVEEMMI